MGWSARPDAPRRLSLHGIIAGRLSVVGEDGPIILTAATAPPPLAPSQPVAIDSVPNNHMSYAFQWFFFAAAALVIYVLALRRRNRGTLPPEP
jgi:cytochrome oxidase assembly protein ShyY1